MQTYRKIMILVSHQRVGNWLEPVSWSRDKLPRCVGQQWNFVASLVLDMVDCGVFHARKSSLIDHIHMAFLWPKEESFQEMCLVALISYWLTDISTKKMSNVVVAIWTGDFWYQTRLIRHLSHITISLISRVDIDKLNCSQNWATNKCFFIKRPMLFKLLLAFAINYSSSIWLIFFTMLI